MRVRMLVAVLAVLAVLAIASPAARAAAVTSEEEAPALVDALDEQTGTVETGDARIVLPEGYYVGGERVRFRGA